jgi:F-box domain
MLLNYLPTISSPVPVLAIQCNARLTFLNFPNEIFRLVFDHLDLPDRASLALTCKPLAYKLQFCHLLLWDSVQKCRLRNHLEDPMADLLKTRLSKDWIPAHLKYCVKCGKFVPRSKDHWILSLEKEFGTRGGNFGQKYRRWNSQPPLYGSSDTILEYECDQWCYPKPRTCPRCKLLA